MPKIIEGFDVSKNEAIDAKRVRASSEADLLAIKWVYKGLICVRTDTSPQEQWICKVDSAPQPGSPNYTDITDWEEFTGTAGSNGTDGATWISGSGTPGSGVGNDDDFFIDTVSNEYYLKITGSWVSQGFIKGDKGDTGATGADGVAGDKYATTSVTSVDLSSIPSTQVMTVGSGLAYTAGQAVIFASTADPLVDFFTAIVTSYSGTALAVGTLVATGTAAHIDWEVNLTGAPGQAGTNGTNGSDGAVGKGFIHNENDITLTASKITSVQGGSYTTQNPWSASVQNDTRTSTQKNATAGIIGDMAKNSIAYDGASWYNNGRWLGLNGTDGTDGDKGDKGDEGTPGIDSLSEVSFHSFINTASVQIGDKNGLGPSIVNIYINTNQSTTFYLPANESNIFVGNMKEIILHFHINVGGSITVQGSGNKFADPNIFSSFIPEGVVNSFKVEDYITTKTGVKTGVFRFAVQQNSDGLVGVINNSESIGWKVVGGAATATSEGPNFAGYIGADGTLKRTSRSDGNSWTFAPVVLSILGFQTRLAGATTVKRNGAKLSSEATVILTARASSSRFAVWEPTSGFVNVTGKDGLGVNTDFSIAIYL